MEKPEKVQSSAGYNSGEAYYRADEMDAYIAELKASLAEMVEYSEEYAESVCAYHGTIRKQGQSNSVIDRARALIGEE